MELLCSVEKQFEVEEFDVKDPRGGTRKMKAMDLLLRTAEHHFKATAFDELAKSLSERTAFEGMIASVDININCIKVDGKDGKPDWYKNNITIRNICIYG